MLKSILFDFDGVIADSVDIKTNAFRNLFKDHPDKLEKILDYHRLNGGISRGVKIKYIYENLLKKELSEPSLHDLCEQYSGMVKEEVIKAPFIKGALEILEAYYKKLKLYIISGTPETEMKEIVNKRGLNKYFIDVYGSPRKKAEIAKIILDQNGFQPNEVFLVGDSVNDFEAAVSTSIPFIAVLSKDSVREEWITDRKIEGKFLNLEEFHQYLKQL